MWDGSSRGWLPRGIGMAGRVPPGCFLSLKLAQISTALPDRGVYAAAPPAPGGPTYLGCFFFWVLGCFFLGFRVFFRVLGCFFQVLGCFFRFWGVFFQVLGCFFRGTAQLGIAGGRCKNCSPYAVKSVRPSVGFLVAPADGLGSCGRSEDLGATITSDPDFLLLLYSTNVRGINFE